MIGKGAIVTDGVIEETVTAAVKVGRVGDREAAEVEEGEDVEGLLLLLLLRLRLAVEAVEGADREVVLDVEEEDEDE